MIFSPTSDALIEKAKESYCLGLIDERRLEYVTGKALTEYGYDAILDLPLSYDLENARALNKAATHRGFWASFRAGFKKALLLP